MINKNCKKPFVRPHLEYSVKAWIPNKKEDKRILEKVQKRAWKVKACKVSFLFYESR